MFLFAILFLTFISAISATPLPHHQKHGKRSTANQSVGSGFAIAICILFLAAAFYYLGMRHERTKSWFSKRNAPKVEAPHGSNAAREKQSHKRQISCPLAVSSSAPIKPYNEAIEVPTPSLQYYEMPVEEVHEMGLPSPKKPPLRASWRSLDCKPWWLKHAEDKHQSGSVPTFGSKSMPNWFKSAKSSNINAHKEALGASSDVTPAFTLKDHADPNDLERASNGSNLIDWSGLEHVRRFYAGRKSKITLQYCVNCQ